MVNINEIERRFSVARKVVSLRSGALRYRLVRINDHVYARARRDSLSIKDDHGLYLHLWAYEQQAEAGLCLAETYAALRRLLGESGDCYDDWKCSFSFPCLLEVQKPSGAFPYLLNIIDVKGGIEYLIYRLLAPDEQGFDRRVVHEPFADEFSRAEINQFIVFMHGYLEGYFSSIKEKLDEWFFKTVRCERIVYGYQQGRFFTHRYDELKDYEAALETAELMQKLAPRQH